MRCVVLIIEVEWLLGEKKKKKKRQIKGYYILIKSLQLMKQVV